MCMGHEQFLHNASVSEFTSVLPPPPGHTLVQGIQHALRDAIIQGRLTAGVRLREIPLADHFGCSTTPVREALRRLEHDGLVTVHPRRGAEVVSIGGDALESLYETRLLLECHGVRRAAESGPSADDLHNLKEMLAHVEGLLDSDDLHLLNSLDMEFHSAINNLSGNHVLADLVERVTRQILVVRVRADARVPGGPRKAHRHHNDIVAAIAAGDADGAEAVMRKHIEWSAQAVRASLRQQRQNVPETALPHGRAQQRSGRGQDAPGDTQSDE